MDRRRLLTVLAGAARPPYRYDYLLGKTPEGGYARLLGKNENGQYIKLIGKCA